jgi:hypothetical protein
MMTRPKFEFPTEWALCPDNCQADSNEPGRESENTGEEQDTGKARLRPSAGESDPSVTG